jgi:hypothetical protein
MADAGQYVVNISEANNSWNKQALQKSRETRSIPESSAPPVPASQGSDKSQQKDK